MRPHGLTSIRGASGQPTRDKHVVHGRSWEVGRGHWFVSEVACPRRVSPGRADLVESRPPSSASDGGESCDPPCPPVLAFEHPSHRLAFARSWTDPLPPHSSVSPCSHLSSTSLDGFSWCQLGEPARTNDVAVPVPASPA